MCPPTTNAKNPPGVNHIFFDRKRLGAAHTPAAYEFLEDLQSVVCNLSDEPLYYAAPDIC